MGPAHYLGCVIYCYRILFSLVVEKCLDKKGVGRRELGETSKISKRGTISPSLLLVNYYPGLLKLLLLCQKASAVKRRSPTTQELEDDYAKEKTNPSTMIT